MSGTEIKLKGIAASPGRATGTAVILEDGLLPSELPDGPLVVIGENIPPDVTQFTSNTCAIVTDEGGILCHGAVLARELQIAAVVGTGDASEKIASGTRVTVDGNEGLVYLG